MTHVHFLPFPFLFLLLLLLFCALVWDNLERMRLCPPFHSPSWSFSESFRNGLF